MNFESGAVHPIDNIQSGWALIKDNYWTFFGMTLVAIIILVVVGIILSAINSAITIGISTALGIAAQNAGEAGKFSAAVVPQLISAGIGLFVNIILTTISGALFCGIYMGLSRISNGQAADFGDLFAGFQKIQPCFIAAILVSLVKFVIDIAILLVAAAIGVSAVGLGSLSKGGQIDPAAFSGLFGVIMIIALVSLVVNLIYSALTTFIYPLIAERDLSGGDAVLVSMKSGLANIGGLILLLILLGLMVFGGLICCLIGVLFVAPIVSASIFSAFQSVFGKTQNNFNYSPPSPRPSAISPAFEFDLTDKKHESRKCIEQVE